tara:strand:- start:1532 stop:1696 length:165 start_codon:yes stop_codon:yes gene_type:complete
MIYQKRDWRCQIVLHWVAKSLGVLIHVDGYPYGANIYVKARRKGELDGRVSGSC